MSIAVASNTPTGYFSTLPPGSALPSGDECAARVRRSTWEPRPANYTANHTTGTTIAPIAEFNATYTGRVNGSFIGTTDEILQWGACKWGLDEDIVRARAVTESNWHQQAQGDYTTDAASCGKFGKAAPCYQSYGILQIKASVHTGTYPTSEQSTSFNVDYSLAWQRACFEGESLPGSGMDISRGCLRLRWCVVFGRMV